MVADVNLIYVLPRRIKRFGMEDRMKRKSGFLAGVLAAGLLLTACGGEFRETGKESSVSGGAVSGGVISGAAVSGDSVDAEPIIEKQTDGESVSWEKEQNHPFSNETNFYREYFSTTRSGAENEYEYTIGFVQYVKSDVSERKQIKIKGFDHLQYVTEEGVYYTRENSSDKDVCEFWRMPIRKGADGNDVLDEAGAEKIFTENEYPYSYSSAYVDSRYIVYMTSEYAVRFDRNSKTRTRHQLEKQEGAQIRIVHNGELVIDQWDGFYQWNLETDEWKRFWKDPSARVMPSASWDKCFFYSYETPEEETGEEIRMYDLSNGENRKLFTDDQISQTCEEVIRKEAGEIKDIHVYKLFCQKGKLYVEVQVNWERSVFDDYYRMNYLMFETDLTMAPELHLNEKMMECIERWSAEDSMKDMEEWYGYIWNAGRCHSMVEGKAIFIMNREGDENRNIIYSYDLSDESCREITSADLDFFLPFYDANRTDYDSFEWQMGEEDMEFLPEELEEEDWYEC